MSSVNVVCNVDCNNADCKQTKHKITFAQIAQSLCLICFSATLMWSALSGCYTILTTPRAFVYLIFAAILLFVLGICSLFGIIPVFAKDSKRILVSLIIPMLVILIPLQMSKSALDQGFTKSAGFDEYASGRAIAIASNRKNNKKTLSGLDVANKKIIISDDDFGNWYDEIDHNLEKYQGYEIVVKGFISRENTLSKNQVRISRQFMSCCILDMSPFGFVADLSKSLRFKNHQWVIVKANISLGNIGVSGYSHKGVVLKVESIKEISKAPSGYFYRT
ncbi:TIGR03943 family putative permease subunit [Gardnerella vaginalis]|uniref:TIGR03943 family putative permease subunit n=1 Tax=Gardnerella vaginalis TaxID=2702 RepID=UPI000352AD4E|nr:TIGR03943 family protein [Gardnerella vaginalis]EPI56811.1 TIGR03943 family protein [Gardnerella vaginalis JCP7275]